MKIGIVTNSAWNVVNYRLSLIKALQREGDEVLVFAPSDGFVDRLLKTGVNFVHTPINPTGLNPFIELVSILKLRLALRRHDVDVVLSFTPKGNLYGLFAICGSRRCAVPNISGLGVVFNRVGYLPRMVRLLYRTALGFASHVFFQNEEDREEFARSGLLRGLRHSRVPGSGIDPSTFDNTAVVDNAAASSSPVFLMLSRALWEKGLGIYVDACRQLKRSFPHARFFYAGQVFADRTGAIGYPQMAEWVNEGVIEYLGDLSDVRVALRQATCVVLPSWYREGVPRSLLEAAAMEKPVITTRSTGCKDTVIDGSTGFLVEPGSVGGLVEAMQRVALMNPEDLSAMGKRARMHVTDNFDERLVHDEYLRVIAGLKRAGVRRRFMSARDFSGGSAELS